MSLAPASLPFVDEHSVAIEADREASWVSLQRVLEATGSSGFARYARLIRAVDTAASGPRPLSAGSAFPGFHVVTADEPQHLALAGRHSFSDYALIFHLDEVAPGRTVLRAETRAEFPGVHGAIYRMLVIRSRAHVLATRRILSAVKRTAEQHRPLR
ncbi:hypothetical protein [Agromyces albus]|uniref:hypothetical protein n=1 Tax=Agromyces albus TaxID=205332 RepID=UPI002783284E|nr:hypothetical protein [Agromyces albus]MDQ0575072.1 hypothetical protein [Agromyces albus]